MSDQKTVDCRGLGCPHPVLETKKALEDAAGSFVVIVDNEAACSNVTRFAESQGAGVSAERKGGEFRLIIKPGKNVPAPEPPPIVCESSGCGKTVVFVSSEGMGRGDDELGSVLMAAFLDTLSQFKGKISHAIFVNGGAKLAVEGSPVLPQIRQLEQVGVEILVCGTCLNYFGIKDRLAAGNISNMYAIVETLTGASHIVRAT
ncbi:MAG TPA: sulfurtransferase-like selenium metabolism protein YedF [Myxococcota bacterium]|nr:sulfurtransferase-like selenium metabolism protein YedF [Myxococcota bacterium]